jgi:hypothetical protein
MNVIHFFVYFLIWNPLYQILGASWRPKNLEGQELFLRIAESV